jgi:hypothetical protein
MLLSNAYELLFLRALGLSVLVELAVLVAIAKIFKYDVKLMILLLSGILATTLTLPYLWFLLPAFIKSRLWYLLIGETSVFVIEALIYKLTLKTSYKRAFLTSFACNSASFIVGLMI